MQSRVAFSSLVLLSAVTFTVWGLGGGLSASGGSASGGSAGGNASGTPYYGGGSSSGGGSPNTPTSSGSSSSSSGGGTYDYYEQDRLIRSSEVVQPLGPNLMGDEVNEFNGTLAFTQEDVSLPGNNALPVAVGRHLGVGVIGPALAEGLFGDWDLEIPHLQTLAASPPLGTPDWYGLAADGKTLNDYRCSQFAQAPEMGGRSGGSTVLLSPEWWWDGYHLDVPGAGTQTLISRYPYTGYTPGNPTLAYETAQPSTGGPYPVLTKEHWDLSCINLASGGNGEGFLAHAPDGSTYQFDRMVTRAYANTQGSVVAPRAEIWILPSQVTDRFGNWVKYTYGTSDPWQVVSISSSDGREIAFTYYSGTHRVYQVTDQTRTWTYAYSSSGALQSVTLPDGSSWQFELTQLEPAYIREKQDVSCYPGIESTQTDTATYTGWITHPSGALGTFTYQDTWHGRTNAIPSSPVCATGSGATGAPMPSYYSNYSLQTKELSGPDMPNMTWTFTYSAAVGAWGPCNPCNGTKTVTIVDASNNTTVNTYGTEYGINEGMLLNSTVDTGKSPSLGPTLRATSYAYAASGSPPAGAPYTSAYPAQIGYNAPISDWSAVTFTPQYQQAVSQQGATFEETITAFDDLARETTLTRSSSLGYSRNESTAYFDQTSLWVLGQVESETIAGLTASNTNYYAATALPQATYAFGKLGYQFTYNADGTLATRTDGLSHTTTLSNYMRGLPQLIQYADSNKVSAVVNNIGTINSATNEANTTWNYTYDAMGRLASATPPQGDPVVYNTENLAFVPVSTTEYGIPADHWRQTITTGTGTTINYFDGRFRKVLTYTADTANPGGTGRFQRFDYDPYNRVTFTSYPVRSITSISDITLGQHTTYDALGRVTGTTQDSELGTLTTATQYLSIPVFQTQFTDAAGKITTSGYQAFDDPDDAKLTSSALPEGVTLGIQRDLFGKALSITRSGTYNGSGVSATRSYVYDANQLLCKTVEPETGATIQTLDAANNVTWKATGQSYISTSTCDQSSVPATAQVGFMYDPRNRVLSITYGDGSPAVSRSYTADGKPLTVSADGSAWTYHYNYRRLLDQETLLYQSVYFVIKHGFDANGHVASLSYPDGVTTVAYNPDALGEPTTVGGAATGVSYAPDGSVAGFTYGNGIVHSQTENERDLPYQNIDSGVLSDQYTYEQRGLVTGITDKQAGITTRTFQPDGLGRLVTANAPNVWGSGSYSYDPLDNIRTSVIGSRSSTHNYNATTNQLTSIVNSGGTTNYAFDVRGNLASKGALQFTFDLGNRIQSAPGVDTFHYDGWFRRTNVVQSNGTNQVWVYDNAGQLLYLTQSGGTGGSQVEDYLYLGQRLVAQSGTAGTLYLHTDVQGSPVHTTNSARAIVSSTTYEPYGNTAAGTVPTTVGYTGHVNDPELGLTYMQARYYDPIAARFLSVDPVVTDTASGRGFGRYAYVGDDPMDKTDPTGNGPDVFGTGYSGADINAMAVMAQVNSEADANRAAATAQGMAQTRAFVSSYEGRQILMHSAASGLSSAALIPGLEELELPAASIGGLALLDTRLHNGGLSGTDYALFFATAIPGAKFVAPKYKAFGRAANIGQRSLETGVEALAATKAAAESARSAGGFDSVRVSSDGKSATGTVTPLGSHIPRKTTCTKDGPT
jgi:RHS repeat-associated protein